MVEETIIVLIHVLHHHVATKFAKVEKPLAHVQQIAGLLQQDIAVIKYVAEARLLHHVQAIVVQQAGIVGIKYAVQASRNIVAL